MKPYLLAAVLVALALAYPVPAMAQGGGGGQVVFGGDYTLETGDTLDGDLIVFGGNAVLEPRSRVLGDVFIMGGNVQAQGLIDGDVAVMGGNIRLLSGAVVSGNVSVLGGNLSREEGARIEGQVREGDGFRIPFQRGFFFPFSFDVGERMATPFSTGNLIWSSFVGFVWLVFRVLMMAALAVLIVMFWPQAAARTGQAMVGAPLASGGLGVLALLAAPAVLLLLLVTIVLSPVSLVAGLLIVVAIVFGWVSLGLQVGNRMQAAFSWDMHPAALAGLGTLLLSFVVLGIGLIPCLGWIPGLALASMGLGAVILTRFGSQTYDQAAAEEEAPPEPKRKGGRKSTKKS